MIGNDWDKLLNLEYEKEYFLKLKSNILNQYKEKIIFPKITEIFSAFKYTPYEKVKVVIIGQDPYHGVGQAEGLSFSVKKGVGKPPSLINVFKELYDDLGCAIPSHGSLYQWTREGVLLLNSVLTVEKDKPASHRNQGWEIFTDEVIRILNKKDTPIVFILWGAYAKNKKALINNTKHLILESSHPSPFSAYNGFFGSHPFSKTNEFLVHNKITPIDWEIKDV